MLLFSLNQGFDFFSLFNFLLGPDRLLRRRLLPPRRPPLPPPFPGSGRTPTAPVLAPSRTLSLASATDATVAAGSLSPPPKAALFIPKVSAAARGVFPRPVAGNAGKTRRRSFVSVRHLLCPRLGGGRGGFASDRGLSLAVVPGAAEPEPVAGRRKDFGERRPGRGPHSPLKKFQQSDVGKGTGSCGTGWSKFTGRGGGRGGTGRGRRPRGKTRRVDEKGPSAREIRESIITVQFGIQIEGGFTFRTGLALLPPRPGFLLPHPVPAPPRFRSLPFFFNSREGTRPCVRACVRADVCRFREETRERKRRPSGADGGGEGGDSQDFPICLTTGLTRVRNRFAKTSSERAFPRKNPF